MRNNRWLRRDGQETQPLQGANHRQQVRLRKYESIYQKRDGSGDFLSDFQTCFASDTVFGEFSFHKPEISEAVASGLSSFDVWVFGYPLYVDGIPSQLLTCLSQIEKVGVANKSIMVFGIVNSGFYEGEQNAIAIEILKNWCDKIGLQWGMGVGVGGGASLSQMKSVPIGKGPKASLGKAFCALKNSMENKTTAENIYISVDFPRLFYKFAAEMGWKQMIKKNGGKVKDLNTRS